MVDPPLDPVAAAEAALARLSGGRRLSRAERRRRWGPAAGAGKHPVGATKATTAERAQARRKRRRSR